jgi:signal transduction histidine kinase
VRSTATQVGWRVLLGACCLFAAMVWLNWERALRARQGTAIFEAYALLESSLGDVEARHRLAVRRARAATVGESPEAQLAWTADRYRADMDRLIQVADAGLRGIEIPNAHPRLADDLGRVVHRMGIVRSRVQAVGTALDLLLEDPARPAEEQLADASLAMEHALETLRTLVRKLVLLQGRHFARGTRATLVVGCLGALGALFLGWAWARCMALTRWVHDPSRPAPSTDAEVLAGALRAAAMGESARGELRAAHERQQRRTRSLEHELLLFRLYNDNLLNSLSAAVVVTDAALRITASNDTAHELGAVRAGDAQIDDTPLYEVARARDERVRDAGAGGLRLRLESLALGDRLIDLEVVPYVDEGAVTRGTLWLAEDVTMQVKTKNDLLASEHMAAVGRLSAQVAHEIRNPLSAIALNAELLEEDLQENKAARTLLRGIASEVERLTKVTDSYLQLARLPVPQCREVDVNQLCIDLMTMLDPQLRAAKVNVELDLATPAPLVWADPGQVRQALLNLVGNAREAMAGAGTLWIRTRVQAGHGVLEVEDTGPGIPTEIQHRVLEPFFSTKPAGTGLGLPLTAQIVADHGGTLEVSAGARGARIALHLPTR